jgi:hypothetical protein
MKFSKFLQENEDLLAKINAILDELDEDEMEDFGEALYYEFFDDEDTDEDDYDFFDRSDVDEMIKELGAGSYEDILDMLEEIEDEDDEDDELEESSPIEELKKLISKKLWHKNYAKAIEMMKDTGKSAADVAKMVLHVDARELQKAYDGLNEALLEGVSRVMKSTNKNRKKRKFMSNTKADMRRTKAQRKKDARSNRSKRKRYYRANKTKVAAYQKSRRSAIKKGSHKVKIRRSA